MALHRHDFNMEDVVTGDVTISLQSRGFKAVFLYCCPANATQMGQATWAIWAAIKKYNLKLQCDNFGKRNQEEMYSLSLPFPDPFWKERLKN